jgi:glycosyltransferase involved in cell wall biosynthesis
VSSVVSELPSDKAPLWRRFDAEWYRARYRDVLGEFADADPEALATHYAEVAGELHLSPNRFFDEEWYQQANPDVASAVHAGSFASGFDHYCRDGYLNRSPHWLFSETAYLARYPDLTRATLDRLGAFNGYDHYLRYGDREFRSGHLLFDPHLYYAHACLDGDGSSGKTAGKASALSIPQTGPFASFLMDGIDQNTLRVSWYFDPEWYLKTYPEVAEALEAGQIRSPLCHFLTNRTPVEFCGLEWFSEAYYLEQYPDIADAIATGQLRSAYDHFLRYGAFERRRPHPDIDLNAYFFSGTVRADIERGLVRDVFEHWLSRRSQQPLDAGLERPDLKVFEGLAVRKAENLLPLLAARPLDFTAREEPRLSIILLVRNRLPLTLSSLSALRMTHAGPLNVIVVDAGSRDDTTRLHHFARGMKILRLDRSVTRAEALKAALPHLRGEAVLWLGQGVRLAHGSLQAALDARADTAAGRIGIVTGRTLRADGRILEAGALIGRDGSLIRYLENAPMEEPAACFRRPVVCATVPALLIDRDLLKALEGFDDRLESEGAQLTDLCLRAAEAGRRVLYEPAFLASQDVSDKEASAFDEADRRGLRQKHAAIFAQALPPSPRLAVRARSAVSPSVKRILFIEDRIPVRSLGSGFVRSNDIVRTMAALGHQVTVFPIYASVDPLSRIYADFPPEVEVLHDRGFETLDTFLQERSGSWDCVWIGRTHNIGRLLPILMAQAPALPLDAVVLDTEAVTSPRDLLKAKLFDEPQTRTLDEALAAEFSAAWFCRKIVAVNPLDVRALHEAGFENVAELGHMCPVRPTSAAWDERRDILFLGAIHEPNSPNHDSLIWFVEKVLPLLRDRLPEDVRFRVAGFRGAGVDLSALGRDPRVELLGPVKDPSDLYASHRIFVAPTRYAGGIPFKIHEAASYGLPVVASGLLCRQLGWRDGLEIVAGGDNDAERFAERVVALYTDEELWNTVRAGALRMLEQENSAKAYAVRLNSILQDVFDPGR